VRAVLDVNILVSALLSPRGAPAALLIAWQLGEFELIVSDALLAELRRALAYPKLLERIPSADADQFIGWLAANAILVADPSPPYAISSPDPDDDYLLALAASASATLVTGDGHLLGLEDRLPVSSPSAYLGEMRQR
jgi:uncharacterized protein